MNQDIANIQFSEEYANENKEIKSLLFDFKEVKNKYIIKNSTGIGATTTMCNYTGGNLIILSPNNSMIESKRQGVYDCDKFMSIYGQSQQDKWVQTLSYLKKNGNNSNVVINTNPEQLLMGLNNEDLAPLLREFNIFVDESHSYFADNSYRPNMGRLLEIIYNDFQGGITLSTATPIPHDIDIPKELGFKYYQIERVNNPTKHLQYSEDVKDRNDFIVSEVAKGRKVAVFTNNKNIHKSEQIKGLKYSNLVGDNLRIKLQKYNKGNDAITPTFFNDADVIYLSSAYFAGFDIPVNCSILIISEQNERAYTISVNDAVQAYGRCRGSVHNALYINRIAKRNGQGKNINYPKSEKEIKQGISIYKDEVKHLNNIINKYENPSSEKITYEGYVNRGLVGCNLVNSINDYYQFNENKRNELFASYNFKLTQYKTNQTKKISNTTPFAEQIRNLYEFENEQLLKDFNKTKESVKYKDAGSFNYKECLYYLATYLIKENNIKQGVKMLDKKKIEPKRFFKAINNWMYINSPIDYLNYSLSDGQLQQAKRLYKENYQPEIEEEIVRDWHWLYAMYQINNSVYDEDISRYLSIREYAGNPKFIEEHTKDKYNRVRNATRAIYSKYDLNNEKEKDKLKALVVNNFKRFDEKKKYTNLQTIKINEKKTSNACIQLWRDGIGNYMNIATRNREYGAITALPTKLRKLIPLEFIELDITSANPQFVDSLIHSNNAFNVYSNIMENEGITRDKAKVKYNTYLNAHKFSIKKAKDFYSNVCGCSVDEAQQLANKTAQVKHGAMFEQMTGIENTIMNDLMNYLTPNSIRLHDALLIPSWEIKDSLPLLFDNVKLHVSYFNNAKEYAGATHKNNVKSCSFLDTNFTKLKEESHSEKAHRLLKEFRDNNPN